MIAFTKSLMAYMQGTDRTPSRFFYYWQWQDAACPTADYVIVDEVQDFTQDEVLRFMHAARKAFFFFGDEAQSIMNFHGHIPLRMEEIAALTGLVPLRLYTNYRLPRAVAKITQQYVGIGVQKYSPKIYRSQEKALPHILQYPSWEAEREAVLRILEQCQHRDCGILLAENEHIPPLVAWLQAQHVPVEYKLQGQERDQQRINTLDFTTAAPKVLTYHSAKGLQFQTVILPRYAGADHTSARKALYVAMTRTYGNLYILYHTDDLAPPLSDVPTYLYSQEA